MVKFDKNPIALIKKEIIVEICKCWNNFSASTDWDVKFIILFFFEYGSDNESQKIKNSKNFNIY